jgi:DNA polymerase III sliding clamp (beta) subunit (PCNA family)
MEIQAIAADAATEALAIVTLNAGEFANAAKLLASKVIERRNTIPVLSALLIEVDPCGRVTLTGTDLDIMVRIELQADASETIEPGRLCLDAGALSDALAKARKGAERVRLTQTDSNRAELKAGRGQWALRGHDAEIFPALAFGPVADMAAPIPAGQFLADLKALAPAVSTEETRYYLNGYAMQARDMAGRDRLVMAATNGSNMAVASRPMPEGLAGWDDAILPRKAGAVILAAAKLYDAGETVTLSRFGNNSAGKAGVAFGPVLIVSKLVDGTFPDWTRAFEGMAAPTGEGEPALFPDMMPGRPLAAMEALAKAAPVAIDWQEGDKRYIGAAAGDPGFVWCAMMLATDNEPRKGYRYSDGESRDYARAYLKALADSHGLPSAESFEAKAERLNDKGGCQYYARSRCHLETSGGRVVGLTVSGTVAHYARWETVQDWEALCVREIEVSAYDEPMEGSYSILMPADGPVIEHDYSVTVEGDRTYPVAVNSGASAIHLSKDQVAALIGDSVWTVLEFPGADGRPRYVSQWLWDDGASRFLCVGKDGRCPKVGAVREYVTREQVEAALAGVAPVMIEAAAPITAECAPVAPAQMPENCADDTPPPGDSPEAPESDPTPLACQRVPDWRVTAARGARLGVTQGELESNGEFLLRVDALEAALSAESARPKRTPAHERMIRRAWSERKAARAMRFNAELMRDRAATNNRAAEFQRDRADAAEAERDIAMAGQRDQLAARERMRDRLKLAQSIAEDHLRMREQMQSLLAATEARLAATQDENAQLWAEIKGLTAPVPALAA